MERQSTVGYFIVRLLRLFRSFSISRTSSGRASSRPQSLAMRAARSTSSALDVGEAALAVVDVVLEAHADVAAQGDGAVDGVEVGLAADAHDGPVGALRAACVTKNSRTSTSYLRRAGHVQHEAVVVGLVEEPFLDEDVARVDVAEVEALEGRADAVLAHRLGELRA